MSNYTPLFYVEVITYPYPVLDVGLNNLYQQKRPLVKAYFEMILAYPQSAVALFQIFVEYIG